YSALPDPSRQTRLITLLASEYDSDPLLYNLETVSLEDAPTSHALSYIWGDPSNKDMVVTNGNRPREDDLYSGRNKLEVTKNLADAMRYLRAHKRTDRFRIWADAICINQEDIEERNEQVKIMHRVYSGAEWVWVWL
ncbi:HET-domain-containing protein, partial [Patellaria atrata CBS 101060]